MEEKINTSKIIVNENHELTDLVRDIHRSKAERIVLTFTEQTDILISPINLRVLQETAEREGKLLIVQIIQNPTGIRNAKLAGIKAIETPSNPTESDWEDAYEIEQAKKKAKVENKKEAVKLTESVDEKKSFEKRVSSSLDENGKKGFVDRRGMKPDPLVSIDGDIPEASLVNRNVMPNESVVPKNPSIKIPFRDRLTKINPLLLFKNLNRKKLLKIGLFGLLPLLVIIVVGLLLYNQFATLAKVKIFVEARPVEVELLLLGDSKVGEIDLENLKIPIKVEEAQKSLSDSVNATGKAFRGEKAKGTVRITYTLDVCTTDTPKLELIAGQLLSSSTSQYTFKLTSSVTINCNNMGDASVEATNIGEEYNLPTGNKFVITGFPSDEVYGFNSLGDFTGGSKEEYTVLSQADVDNAVEQLSLTAIEEVKSELREVGQGWEIIEDTIRSEVDKSSIKTDKQVGTEASTVNLDLTIKGTATYYLTTGLIEGLTELLTKQAEEDNLFESDSDIELVLGENIEKEITVEKGENDVIKVKIEAKSTIKPKVDKNELANTLSGMEWEEGKTYINNLKYAERKAEIVFQPENYPDFLKRFPERRGGVMVTIVELEI